MLKQLEELTVGSSLFFEMNCSQPTLHYEPALSIEDVLTLSQKFWELHMDKICILDGAATTLLTIQYNLVAGTLAPYAIKRPELGGVMQQILNYDISYANISLTFPLLETHA